VEEAINYLADHPLEILPVFKNKEDQLVGYVEVSVIFAQLDKKITLSELIEPLIFVPETMRADCMLEQFMKQSVHMVAVVDEYGGLSGTLTIDNLLHDVVGEFDWHDTSPVESLGNSTYRLEGRLSVKEWRNLFVGYIPAQVVDELALDTLSGLVISLLKRIPRVGDVVKLGNLSFTVDRVRGNRIESVLLKLDSNEVTQ
jgi:CBS domain containing-hemolysin-like protein